MILTAEALAELRKDRDGVFGVGTIHDLLDTIADLQRQLRERDATVKVAGSPFLADA